MFIAKLPRSSSYYFDMMTATSSTTTSITRASFEKIYRNEQDVKIKERMLLVLNVVYSDRIAAQVAKDLYRSRAWACWWLKRYYDEGIEGLKDKPKGGRHSKITKQVEDKIKAILKESNQGWTTKQVEELIVEKSGGIKYHYVHICRILHKWGFRQKVPRKVHVNTASKEEKEDFKKRQKKYL